MRFYIIRFIILLVYCGHTLAAYAQEEDKKDTIHYSISAIQSLSQKDYAPHYMMSNRFGILDTEDGNASLVRASVFSEHQLFKKARLSLGLDAYYKVSYQEEAVSSAFLQQAYAAFQYDFLKLTVGRIERTVGMHDEELSSGSLAISRNAPPIPHILLEVPEFTNIPFTKGYLQFKGSFAHGWLNDERFIDEALLHEKSLYVRLGNFKFKPYAGLVHFVTWGGTHPTEGPIPATFRDYLLVITARNAENVPEDNNNVFGETLNALGDTYGIYDFGADLSLKPFNIQLYYQMPYEDWSGIRPWKNRDQLIGLDIHNKTKFKYVSKLNYEYLNTMYQSGPSLTDEGGRDNYYNNYLYKTGWTYQNFIIGTPLFFTVERTQTYIPGFEDPDAGRFDFNVVNNRIIAHHVGLQGGVIPQLEYKLLVTTTLNHGTYGGINGSIQEWGSINDPDLEYEFNPPLRQYYMLLETLYKINSDLNASLSLTMDSGDLSQNFGIMLGIKWSGGQSLSKE